MNPLVDVVVVSYNSRATLRECIEPLTALPSAQIIVVDNNSPDGSPEVLAGLPVRTIQSRRNAGFGAGCNVGLAAGDAPFVLFLNPDAIVAVSDIERLVSVLRENPDVAIVGPRILDSREALVHSMRRGQRAGSIWAQALFLHRLVPHAHWANEIMRDPGAYEVTAYPEWISGACMLARRTAIERVGGFDERFFLYCEDMDLCARLRAAGGRVRFEPLATARHREGASAPRPTLFGVLARSRVLYARKHAAPLNAALQQAGVVVEALTHMLANVVRPQRVRGYAGALRCALAPRARRARAFPVAKRVRA